MSTWGYAVPDRRPTLVGDLRRVGLITCERDLAETSTGLSASLLKFNVHLTRALSDTVSSNCSINGLQRLQPDGDQKDHREPEQGVEITSGSGCPGLTITAFFLFDPPGTSFHADVNLSL